MGARRALFCLLLALAGCGGGSSLDRATTAPCETSFPAKTPADTVTVVLFDTVDLSHAPWGRNREERFVFSHLYETLVNIDCRGEVVPGLAQSWKRASDGWLFTLREDAHFWDETAVTAQDVVESLKPAIEAGLALKSAAAVDDRSLLVYGHNGPPDIKLLSLPMTAVRKTNDTISPIGTGPWLVDETNPNAKGILIRPASGKPPVVRFMRAARNDPRDIMDAAEERHIGADALITDAPEAIDYARERIEFSFAPLAWDRAYVLISRSRAIKIASGGMVGGIDKNKELVETLARDAVQIDARGGSSIVVDAEAACVQRTVVHVDYVGTRPPHQPTPHIVYAARDETARNLAERLVALAARDTSSSEARTIIATLPGARAGLRAVASDDLRGSLEKGDALAYVVPLSWNADFPFLPVRFVSEAAWLFDEDHRVDLSDAIVPLIETRAHFIALSDRIGYSDDKKGNVRIVPFTPEPK